MPYLARSCAAALAIAASLLAGSVAAQQAPAELPKGLFPPGLPGQAPSTTSAPAPVPAPRAPDTPVATPEAVMPTLPDGRLAVPPLARVTDTAGVLNAAARDQLEGKLAAFEQAKGSQIAVVVVPSTQPEPISDFTNRVGDAWKIGRKGVGDGVLMVVAVKDRRVWISVARALEGAIPDVVATRITREFMGPQFARGDFAAGIDAGVSAVMKQIEGEALPTPSGVPRNKVDAGEDLLGALVPLVIFGTLVGALLRRIFGVPGSMLSGAGTGAIAGFMLSSLVVGAIAGIAVMVLSGFGGGRGPLGGGRVLGGRRGAPVILPGGWSGGGSWGGGFGGGGGGGWSSGGGGDFAGGGGGSSW
ncbi:MAG: TPM domain-containing protein [Burkholderiaceae bacterium]